ncbi:MAG: hypothetical protein VW378_07975 [bacterium]
MQNKQTIIGLQLNKASLSYCQISKESNILSIKKLKTFPLTKESYTPETGYNIEQIAKEILAEDPLPTGNAILCFTHNDGIKNCSKISVKNLEKGIEKHANELLNNPPILSTIIYQEPTKSQHNNVLYAAIEKEKINTLTLLAKALNLDPIDYDLGNLARVRSLTWQHTHSTPHIYINKEHHTLDLHIHHNNNLIFSQSIYLPHQKNQGKDVKEKIKKKINLAIESFFNLYPEHKNIQNGTIALDTKDHNDYQEIIFHSLPEIQWQHYTANNLPSSTETLETIDLLNNLSCIGAALKNFDTSQPYNLLKFTQTPTIKIKKNTLSHSLLLVAFFTIIYITLNLWINKENRQLQKKLKHLHTQSKNLKRAKIQESKDVNTLQKQVNMLKQAHKNNPKLYPLFETLMAELPQDISLLSLSINKNTDITLTGEAYKQSSIYTLYKRLKPKTNHIDLQEMKGAYHPDEKHVNQFTLSFSLKNKN